jgi:hypothetical protein
MSQYTAHLPREVLQALGESEVFEELLEDMSNQQFLYNWRKVGVAPEIIEAVVVEDPEDYHAAAEAFALAVRNRRKPVVKRFDAPCDPWL